MSEAGRRTKILMTVAKSFPRDVRVRLEASTLQQAGYDVEVLAWDREAVMPALANVCGVIARRIRIVGGAEFRKLTFALASVIFQFACVVYALRLLGHERMLVIHSHDFNSILVGSLLKIIFRDDVRFVYDCHEFTPGAYAEWYGNSVGRLASVIERALARRADAVITVSDPIANYLQQVLSKSCTVVWNCPPKRDIPKTSKDSAREKLALPEGFLILCMGLFRQDLEYDVLRRLRSQLKNFDMTNVHAVFVGSGFSEDFLSVAGSEPEFFIVREWVPPDLALLYYRACDLTFCMYSISGANSKVGMPWKLFESVMCGTPVLVSRGSYLEIFVRNHKCGVWANPNSTAEVAEAVRELRQSMLSGTVDFEEEVEGFTWEEMETRLCSLYAGITKNQAD